MKIWSWCFAYMLCFGASVAQGESRRALEMAECGYLLGLAAEQLHARADRPEDLSIVVGEIIDFTNLYYHLSDTKRPNQDPGMSLDMYRNIMDVGRDVFDRRISGMREAASDKLANRIMNTCREDLHLLGLKLGQG